MIRYQFLSLLSAISSVVILFATTHSIGALATNETSAGSIVQTKYGLLQGQISKSRNGNEFHEFLGVQFAVVKTRFEPAVETEKWEDVKAATKAGPQCLQNSWNDTTKAIGEENCLFLNVHTPKVNTEKKYPVMVFIHGGGFFLGNGHAFGPKYLMDHDVVLVTLNYRLGPFGFLNAGIEEAGGNMGLKDQVLALKWVQENIKEFGGDPDRVTIFGESAGGVSVTLLTLSPIAKGLFQNAIGQSGSALSPVGFTGNPLKQAKKLAVAVDCPTSNIKYMIECLKKIKPEYIAESFKCQLLHFDDEITTSFLPSVETYSDESKFEKFLPKEPYQILNEGDFKPVPLIMGLNENEGFVNAAIILENETLTTQFDEEWGNVAPIAFVYTETAKDRCVISSKIKEFYLNNGNINKKTLEGLSNIYSDRWSLHSTKLMAKLYSKHAPTYLYNFTTKGTHSLVDWIVPSYKNLTEKTATHFDEIQYLFSGQECGEPIEPESPMYSFSENFLTLWTSFAKNGTPSGLWGEENQQWLPLAGENGTTSVTQWLQIDKNATMLIDEDPAITARYEFWESLPLQENGNSKKIVASKTEL